MRQSILPLSLLSALLLTFISPYSFAQVHFTVNSLADDSLSYAYDNPETEDVDESMDGICGDAAGRCTLGAAIGEASNMSSSVNIEFSVEGTIKLRNGIYLPDGSEIDGSGKIELSSETVCMDVNDNTIVKGIKFRGKYAGLTVGGKHNKIGGFSGGNVFVNCMAALLVGGDSNEVVSNYFGLDSSQALNPNTIGILMSGSHNIIGKAIPGYANIICGSTQAGIEISYGGNNEVLFNYIGTTTDGKVGYGNNQGIIIAGSDSNKIGSESNPVGNIISGNTLHGIFLSGAPPESYSFGNIVANNIIGLTPLQSSAVPNGNGIVITNGAFRETISDNIVAGNKQNGILIFASNDTTKVQGIIIQDNKIGVNKDVVKYPNENAGIIVQGNVETVLIGTNVANGYLPNIIAGNSLSGITVRSQFGFSPKSILLRKNLIYQNGVSNLVVDTLSNYGVKPPFGLSYSGNTLGGLHNLPNVLIDVYRANRSEGPPSAYEWLGSTTADANGVFTFDIVKPSVEAVSVIATTFSTLSSSAFAMLDILTGIDDEAKVPKEFVLGQNYPNPFNPSTTIHYELPSASHVTLTVYDVLGREVTTLVSGAEEPGYKSVHWDASAVASGVYLCRLTAGEFVATKKLVLLR
jgi:hypothetical protein